MTFEPSNIENYMVGTSTVGITLDTDKYCWTGLRNTLVYSTILVEIYIYSGTQDKGILGT